MSNEAKKTFAKARLSKLTWYNVFLIIIKIGTVASILTSWLIPGSRAKHPELVE